MRLKIPVLCALLVALAFSSLAATPEQRLADLGIALKPKGIPKANYVYAVQSGNLVFLAGHVPINAEGEYVTGVLGDTLTVEQGQAAARLSGISLLASLKQEIGDLSRVKRIVKAMGMVNANAEFTQHSQVINGFSDLMVEVFGDKGKHARAAVGMSSLPLGVAVEIEMIVELNN